MTGFFPFVRSLAKLTPTLIIVEESKIKYRYGTKLLDEVRSDLRSKGLPKKDLITQHLFFSWSPSNIFFAPFLFICLFKVCLELSNFIYMYVVKCHAFKGFGQFMN